MDLSHQAIALHHLVPLLGARDPLARAVARDLLRQLALALPPAALAAAQAEIATEGAARGALAQERHTQGKQDLMDRLGPKLWREWHLRALTVRSDDTAYLIGMAKRLPCGECARNFTRHLEQLPPVYGEGYFAWTVEFHNLVRTLQGKPTMTVADAHAFYTAEAAKDAKTAKQVEAVKEPAA